MEAIRLSEYEVQDDTEVKLASAKIITYSLLELIDALQIKNVNLMFDCKDATDERERAVIFMYDDPEVILLKLNECKNIIEQNLGEVHE